MNCFGRDKTAAMANTKMLIPQVEKTAVVTNDFEISESLGMGECQRTHNDQEWR